MNISELFIRRPVMTVALTVSVILFGLFAYFRLPVSDLPAVDYPVIQVQVNYPGATPDTMANNVATPLERQFMQIPGLELVTSNNVQGHTNFVLQFRSQQEPGWRRDRRASRYYARIRDSCLSICPARRPLLKPTRTISRSCTRRSSATRRQKASFTTTPTRKWGNGSAFLPGVSQVAVFGTQSAVRIKADPSAMAIRNITLEDLTKAIKNGTSYTGAGQFDGPHRSFLLQPQGQLSNAEQYDQLIVGQNNGAPVYLKDVATAQDRESRTNASTCVSGRVAIRQPGAHVVVARVSPRRRERGRGVQVGARPVAVHSERSFPARCCCLPPMTAPQTIVGSIKDVQATLYIAFVLVVMVIFVFLGRATDTLIPAVALAALAAADIRGYDVAWLQPR